MRRSTWLASIAVLAVPFSAAFPQTQRWNDRAQAQAADDAPKVSVDIEGTRILNYGQPVRVHFRVSDDAYVVVARVSSDGRLTILFPQNPTGRTFVRGNVDMIVRGRQTGSFASFYAHEYSGTGYVFAIASYAPLDLSRFKYADFDRSGFSTPFQLASRSVAFRPEAMMERFANWVIYDNTTEFDYDVDFYSVSAPVYASALAACSTSGYMFGDWDAVGPGFGYNPYRSLCGGYYNAYLSCLGFSIYNYYGACVNAFRPYIVTGTPPNTPTTPVTEPGSEVNPKVVLGGIPHPNPTPMSPVDDGTGKPTEQPSRVKNAATPRSGEGWDHLYAIPNRSLDQLKRSTMDEMRRKDAGGTSSRSRGWAETEARGSDARTGVTGSGQPQPRAGATRTADAPAREPAAYQPRRTGGSDDNSPRGSSAAPARETPRTYSPAGETPRSSAPPRESPRSEPAARASTPAHEAPAASPKASSSGGSQTTKSTSGSTSEPKKPPM